MSQPAPASASGSAPALSSSPASSPSSSDAPQTAVDLQALFDAAACLLLRAVPLVKTEFSRLQSSRENLVSAQAALLATKRLELQLSRSAAAPRILELEQAVAKSVAWLDQESAYKESCFAAIETARTVAEQSQASLPCIFAYGAFCSTLFSMFRQLPRESTEQGLLRVWMLEVDDMFTQLAAAVPQLNLSSDDQQSLLRTSLSTGALQLIPAVMRISPGAEFPSIRMRRDFFLTHHCSTSIMHFVSRQPYFRLFEYGMDPTEVAEGGNPMSMMQLARAFVRDHPRSPDEADAPLAADEPVRSMLPAWAAQARTRDEDQRRDSLRAQFMHALIPAWRAHSDKVRAVLFAAAPDRLIAPLVDVVSRYLDLEGVRAEPAIVVSSAEDASDL